MDERPPVTFRFYQQLNDFLPGPQRKRDVRFTINRVCTVREAIESVGVPPTKVDLVLVDGESVDFNHRLHGGERVAVYPAFESLDIAELRKSTLTLLISSGARPSGG